MDLLQKFILVFAVLGLIISLSVGFTVGNRLTHVLVTGLICTLLGGALGFGVFKVIEIRIPEFFDYFGARAQVDQYEDVDTGISGEMPGESASAYESGYEEPIVTDETGRGEGEAKEGETQVFGDHILVNKVKIKNEPKLIAQAIQTMMAKDEE
jgi:hypothetical protein